MNDRCPIYNTGWIRLIIITIFMTLFFSATGLSVFADITLNIDEYGSFSAVFDVIPEDAGTLTLKLSPETNESVLDIPANGRFTDIYITAPDGMKDLSLPGLERICANGVPLIIDRSLTLENASIYGGACVNGTEASLDTSNIRIAGAAGFVFGGGFAENGGTSSVSAPSVTVEEGALVYYEVFGGGHAVGEGSRALTDTTSVTMLGTSDYVLGAGFAETGGIAECGNTFVTVGEKASVEVALFGGGSASGEGSLSTVGDTLTRLLGFAHWAFSGDFAFDGGRTRLDQAGRLEILPSGSAVNAYLGGFASDPGSNAEMNTAELMNCGTVDLVLKRSQSTDGGKASTLIPAVFPCEESPASE